MQENIDIKINIDGSNATKDINKTLAALEDLRGEMQKVAKGSKEFEELKKAQRELAKEAFAGAKSFKEQQRAFEELQDALGGLDKNSEDFREFVKVVGAAKDEMDFLTRSIDVAANDMAKLEAGVQIGEAIAASFAVTTGVMALFGVESKKTEEIEKNLIAVLAVLNGLNSIANLIRKENIATQLLQNLQTRIFTGLLGKQRVAQIAANVATGQATIAQRALNLVMRMNPVMLLISAVAALTAAYTLFGDEQEEVIDNSEEINERLQKEKELRDGLTQSINTLINSELNLIKERQRADEIAFFERIKNLDDEQQKIEEYKNFKIKQLQEVRNKEKELINQDQKDREKNLKKLEKDLLTLENEKITSLYNKNQIARSSAEDKLRDERIKVLQQEIDTIENLIEAADKDEITKEKQHQNNIKEVRVNAQKQLNELLRKLREENLDNALDLQRRELDAMKGIDDIHVQNKSKINDERLRIDREYYSKVESLITGSNRIQLDREKELYLSGKKSLEDFLKIREDLTRNSIENLTRLEKTYYDLLTEQRTEDLNMLQKRFELEDRLSFLLNKNVLLEDIVRGNILKKVGETNNLLSSQIDLTYLFGKQTERASQIDLDFINKRNRALSDLGHAVNLNQQAVMTVYFANEDIISQSARLKTASEEEKKEIQERINMRNREAEAAIALIAREKEIIERDGKIKNKFLRQFLGADAKLREESLKLELQAFNVYLEDRLDVLQKTTKKEIEILNEGTLDALGISKELKDRFRQEFGKGLGFTEALDVLKADSSTSTEIMKMDKVQKEQVERNYWKEIVRIRREATDRQQGLENQRFELEDKIAQERLQKQLFAIQKLQEAQQMATSAISDSINYQYDLEIKRIDELEQKRLEAFDRQQQLQKMRDENATIADYQALKREETIAKKRKEIEEDAQAERNRAQLEQWEKQKALRMAEVVMNTATAISLVTAQTGVAAPFAIPIIVGINAAQLALIAAEQPPIFERGGMIGGERHSNGGTMVEAEEGEVIINRKSAKMFRGLLSQINEMGGGVKFAESGPKERAIINNEMGLGIDYEKLASVLNNRPIKTYVTESDITASQNSVRKQKMRTTF